MRKTEFACIAGLIGLAFLTADLSAAAIGNETTTYAYDALGRLSGSSIASGPNNGRFTGTCFDGAGNRMRYDVATSAPATCPTPTATPTPVP